MLKQVKIERVEKILLYSDIGGHRVKVHAQRVFSAFNIFSYLIFVIIRICYTAVLEKVFLFYSSNNRKSASGKILWPLLKRSTLRKQKQKINLGRKNVNTYLINI